MKSSSPHKRVPPRRLVGSSPARRRSTTNRLSLTRVAFMSRMVSLSVLTAVGWAVVNSIGTLPSSVPSASRPSTARVFPVNEPAGDPLFTGVLAPTDSKASSKAMEEAVESLSPFQLSPLQSVAKANNVVQATGTQIRINGETLPGLWQQKNGRIGVASASLANLLGAELLSTTSVSQQPIRWFPASQESVVTLPAWWDATNRYIDISDLAATSGWTGQAAGNVLQLAVPTQQTLAIRQGRQTWGDRVVVDLTGPVTWQIEETDVYTITVGGNISTEMVRAFRAMPGNLITQLHVAPLSGKTVIKIKTKDGASPQIWTAGNPAKVVIDIRRDAMVERDIAWAPGLRWRQQYISVGQHRFPVYMFITRPNPQTLALRPISANPNAAPGIEPILSTAQRQQVTGAVNAGFFNRNNQLPLGAVRRGGQWISGPILGRGAMAWNDRGDLVMDRFALAESVAASGQTYSILAVNSGYVQAGIGRYTSGWGATYTPIVDNEIVVTVRNNRVAQRQTMGTAGSGSVAIPSDGYLLTLRSNRSAGDSFAPGTPVNLVSQSQPAVFEQYPNVIGGGPLLIRDRTIVLNPQLEGFSRNFIEGSAPRTAVGKTADGTWIIATMHDRVGGRGPNLQETAQIMQQLGAVDALNLDGGSSSSLYLGGQLLNRQPRTAARVNNGIGLFVLQP
ncbi:MAG: phosphodiester glycosidase family protein [Cyanobacteria bacterium J06627_28]